MSENRRYASIHDRFRADRRQFLKAGGAIGAGLLLGTPAAWAADEKRERPATNIDEAMAVPRGPHALPGPFPGRVVEVHDPDCMPDDKPDGARVEAMFRRGLNALTSEDSGASFRRFFRADDIVGIKVNPVGAGLISTRLEVVDAIVAWLEENGLPRGNIVIWDRFDYMLADAGYTPERYPGVRIEGLQTMDESAFEEGADQSGWLAEDGRHRSEDNFDLDWVYRAEVDAPEDRNYLHQHVFADKRSPFGKLVTQDLTKIINVPVMKNTGNGISVATKNMGYGAVCNTGRLHRPLFFDVCTEVLAFPPVREKMVLNVADALRAQYEGGPMPNAAFAYRDDRLFLATDPFALDRVCHDRLVAKRKAEGIAVNENPMFTDYLRYAEKLGIGVGDPAKIERVKA